MHLLPNDAVKILNLQHLQTLRLGLGAFVPEIKPRLVTTRYSIQRCEAMRARPQTRDRLATAHHFSVIRLRRPSEKLIHRAWCMGLLLTASGRVVLAADVRYTSFLTPLNLEARIEKALSAT